MNDVSIVGATAIVIVSWCIVFCVITGLGQFVRMIFRAEAVGAEALFSTFWIGYVVLIAALHWWHFFLPIDWRISTVLGVAGLTGFILRLRVVRINRRLVLKVMVAILLLAPIAVWLANRALDRQLDYDSAFYHINYIRWLNEYPAVIGLGNLHYRLAFNQSLFMFVAALNIFPYFNQGFHIANSLLIMTLIAQSVVTWVKLLFAPNRLKPASLLSIILLPVLLYRASHQPYSANISSPSPDLSIFVLMIVVMIHFVDYLTNLERTEIEKRFTLFSIIAISAVGITSKLSFAAFGITMIILAALLWIVRQPAVRRVSLRQALIWLTVVGLFVGIPWVGHGIIASGYPLFPATVGALPVDWKVPTSITVEARDWIYSFARERRNDMYTVLSSWDWLKSWINNMQDQFSRFLFVLPAIGSLIGFILYLIVWLFCRKRNAAHTQLWLPFLPALVSGLFWFLTAPDPRFAGSAFWLLVLWTPVALIALLRLSSRRVVYSVLAVVGVIAVIVFVGIFPDHFKTSGQGFPPISKANLETFHTDSGLIVHVPANNSLLQWDAPLPSSPYKLPKLELRGNDLRDGFRTRPD
jgi:hypothetical protein